MNRKDTTKARIILTVILGCVCVFLYYYILNTNQKHNEISQTQKEMEESVSYLKDAVQDAKKPFEEMSVSIDEIFEEDLLLLCDMAQRDPKFKISDAYLKSITDQIPIEELMITDREGKVLASGSGAGRDLTDAALDSLKESFETGGMCRLQPSDDTVLYIMAYDEEHAFVIKVYNWFSSRISPESYAWLSLLDNATVGQEGFMFAWSDTTKELLYYPAYEFISQTVDVLGMDQDRIKDGRTEWQNVDGTAMYVYTCLDGEEGVWIACAVSREEVENTGRFNRILLTVVFLLLTAALVYYIILLLLQKKVKVLMDFTGTEKMIGHKNRRYKLFVLTILLVAVLLLMHFYLHTLYLMSTWAESATRQTDRIEESVKREETIAQYYIDYFEMQKKSQISFLAHFLSENPKLCVASVLDDYAARIRADQIRILNPDGSVSVETSSTAYQPVPSDVVSDTPAEENGAVQESQTKVCDWMAKGRTETAPLTDKRGSVKGYLKADYYSEYANEALRSFSLSETLKRIQPGSDGVIFSVDAQTKTFSSFPDAGMEGKDVLEYGLTENQLKDHYCDYITIDGVSYYAATDKIGTDVIFYAVEKNKLLANRLRVSLMTTLLSAVLFLLTGLPLYTNREQIEIIKPERGRHSFTEDKNTPEYRILRVLMNYAVGAAAIMAAYSVFRENTGTGSVIGYVLDGRWERGINVFALSYAILIMSRGGIVLFFFSKLVRATGDILPVRYGTILKMLGSLATYAAVAFLIYRCMICFGLNPTALMASAGIVSVVLGIGANSLVGDILAGLFLLMEGNVQVGDVVQIGNFRGYVMDLGIRMTKLFDMDSDDVKIIPNNEVRNVVHMTMRTSIVYSEFQIRYEEKLESVERILQEELRNYTGRSPLILNGPVYIGVCRLDESGVVLKTATRCHESSRRKVEREVNHIVYSIFQKNDISVPFPQVTIHQGDDSPVERDVPDQE